MAQRPDRIILNGGHPLATGLLFAGLGELPLTTHYRDSSLWSNHGTLTGMAVPATATSGWTWDNYLGRWVMRFDGSDDQVTVAASNIVIPTGSSFTAGGWIYPTANGANDAMWFGSGYNGGWMMDMGGGASRYSYLFLGGAWKRIATTLPLGSWSSIFWVVSSVGTAGCVMEGYLNGVSTGPQANSLASAGTRTTLYLGRNGQTPDSPYTGKIADPIFYNRALSASEIAALADPSNVMLSGLILPLRRRMFAASIATGNRRRRQLLCGVSR